MVDITEVAKNIYLIDDSLFCVPKSGSVYLVNEEKKALIDTGPATSSAVVLEGLKEAGVTPEEIDYIILTHIHLDHCGGAGVLIRQMPNATVLVHPKGVKHMINPANLVKSMLEVQGEDSIMRHGAVLPISEKRIKAVEDGEEIKLSDQQTLRIIDAPGHAPHEICIHESRNNGVFIGEAAGTYIEEENLIMPESPPPSFDMDLFVETLDKLKDLKPDRLYYAHYGVNENVQECLQKVVDVLKNWEDMIAASLKNNYNKMVQREITEQVRDMLAPLRENSPLKYDCLANEHLPRNVYGFMGYYEKKYGVKLNKVEE